MFFFYPVRKRAKERISPEMKKLGVGAVYYRTQRKVKNNVIKYCFKYFTAEGLEKFNEHSLHLFENLKGDFFAQTTGGHYCFKLERITKEEANKIKYFYLYRQGNYKNG